MASKPSERRNFQEDEMEINLKPIMNLLMILIPCLLISMVFVEITVINVSAPAIGQPDPSSAPTKPEKPPLNLTVTITDKGYTVAGAGGVLEAEAEAGAEKKGPSIPLKELKVNCSEYLGTVPPPRHKNKNRPKCSNDDAVNNVMRTYLTYDNEALARKLVEIKDAFPDEKRIIITGEPNVVYGALIAVMDSSREIKDEASGEKRELFPEVVISPGFI
jgi:biopolymer transport protein ExbD